MPQTNLVAVGAGTYPISVSTDSGFTWTLVTDVSNVELSRCVWNGTYWLACSGTTTIFKSSNGTVWIPYVISYAIYDIVWNGSLWCGSFTNGLVHSVDGVAWSATNLTGETNIRVAYDLSGWVAIGSFIYTSSDGISWTSIGTNTVITNVAALRTNGTDWLLIGSGTNTLAHSSNGIQWTAVPSIFDSSGLTIEWNGTVWVAGGVGSINTLAYSFNGQSWFGAGNELFQVCTSVIWNGVAWVATGLDYSDANSIANSDDGQYWTDQGNLYGARGTVVNLATIVRPVTLQTPVTYNASPYSRTPLFYPVLNPNPPLVNSYINTYSYSMDPSGFVTGYLTGNTIPIFIAPTRAGDYTVLVSTTTTTSAYDIYLSNNLLTIDRNPVTIVFNTPNLVQSYTGSQIGIAATITANTVQGVSTLSTVYNYFGVTPIDLGSYPVAVSPADVNYIGTESVTFSIVPLFVSIDVTNTIQTYTGFPLEATVTLNPPNLATPVVLYNNALNPPTNADTYSLVVSVTGLDSNASSQQYVSTFTILKQTVEFTYIDTSVVYQGYPQKPTAIINPPNLTILYTFNGSSNEPTNVGNYNVIGTIDDSNYTGTETTSFSITRSVAYISFLNLEQAYTGSYLIPTIETYPYGASTFVTYNGQSTNLPVEPGYYVVGVNISDVNYQGFNWTVFTILKVPASVTLNSKTAEYTGRPLSTFGTTLPVGLGLTYLYNGLIIPPTEAGIYDVVANISDIKYTGSASNIFTITKKTAQVSLTNVSQTFNGNPISPTVVTIPSSLNTSLSYTYQGIPTTPIQGGNYNVVATIEDTNYNGSTTGILTITKFSTPIVFVSTVAVYDNTVKSAVASTFLSSLQISYTYQNRPSGTRAVPISAGTYDVTASIDYDRSYGGTLRSTFTILPAVGSVEFKFISTVYTYDGAPHFTTQFVTNPFINIGTRTNYQSYNYRPGDYSSINAPSTSGIYTQFTNLSDPNFTGGGSTILQIRPAPNTIEFPETSVVYNTEEQPISTLAYSFGRNPDLLAVDVRYDGYTNIPVNAGTYNAVATIRDTNYTGVNSTLYTITKAVPQIIFHTMNGVFGTPYVPDVSVIPSFLTPFTTFSYLDIHNTNVGSPSNAGPYTLTATVNAQNYAGVSTTTITIDKFDAPLGFAALTQIYSGEPVSPYLVTIPPLHVNYTYFTLSGEAISKPSEYGSYSIYGIIDEPNYKGSTVAEFSIVLGPVENVVAYPISGEVVLVWSPPVAVTNLSYTLYTIPRTYSITTNTPYTKFSNLINGISYQFVIEPTDGVHRGLPYEGMVETYSGEPTQPGTADGIGPSARYTNPRDCVVDSTSGTVYIADNTSIRVIDTNYTVTTLPIPDLGIVGGIALWNGTLYITDSTHHTILHIELSPFSSTLLAGGGMGAIAGNENGTGAAALFNTPTGIAVDEQGIVFVADTLNHQIRRIDTTGVVTTYAGTGYPGNIDARSPFALFNAPQGVTTFGGIVYVADTGNHSLRSITPADFGIPDVMTIVGNGEGYRDGNCARAQFNGPTKIIWNRDLECFFIADAGNNIIRRMDIACSVTTLAGITLAGTTNGRGFISAFNTPTGITISDDVTLYVADRNNYSIRRIRLNPIVSSIPDPANTYISDPPTDLFAIQDIHSLTLSWIPPLQPIVPVTSYTIIYNGNSVDTTAQVFTLSSLTAATSYTITVFTNTLFGQSLTGTTITVSTLPTVTTITIVNTLVYYNASEQNPTIIPSPPGLPYTISYGGDPTQTSQTAPGTYTGAVDINYNDYSANESFSFTILDVIPSAPLNPTAIGGVGNVVLSWSPPSYKGTGRIVYYTVSYSSPIAYAQNTANGAITTMTLNGLTNGTTYTFSITATNIYGEDLSGISPAVYISATPLGPPTEPLSPSVAFDASGHVFITWSQPMSDGGQPIQSYTVYVLKSGVIVSQIQTNTPDLFYTVVSGLIGGTEYQFQIAATNSIGTGVPSLATNANSIVAETVPDAPTVSAVVNLQKATVSWAIPHNGGQPITGYTIQTIPPTSVTTVSDGETTSFDIFGLTPGVTYCFTVAATNVRGTGPAGRSPYCTVAVRTTNELFGPRTNRPAWFS